MYKKYTLALCTCLFFILYPSYGVQAMAVQKKEAILLVAFGTSAGQARTAYTHIENAVRAQYPDTVVCWAWSARSLRHADTLSIQEALAKLAAEDVTHVSILALYVLPGAEYHDIIRIARAFEGLPKGIQTIRVSPPLLYDTQGIKNIAHILLNNAPTARTQNQALLFVGHGTRHPAGVYYPALQYFLQILDKNAFVATLDNNMPLETVVHALQARAVRTVWLIPLMTVAGQHSLNDMFGTSKESWQQRLNAEGIQVEAVRTGLGDNPAIVQEWLRALHQLRQ